MRTVSQIIKDRLERLVRKFRQRRRAERVPDYAGLAVVLGVLASQKEVEI